MMSIRIGGITFPLGKHLPWKHWAQFVFSAGAAAFLVHKGYFVYYQCHLLHKELTAVDLSN